MFVQSLCIPDLQQLNSINQTELLHFKNHKSKQNIEVVIVQRFMIEFQLIAKYSWQKI